MRYYIVFLFLWIASSHLTIAAQEENPQDSNAFVTNSFWDNWYGQVGVDMNLLFPSGHASMAFAAARSIDKEFRKDCIWIPIAGYAAATAVGVERVASDRHHWYDVLAGAGVGIGAAELTWWLSDLCFGKGKNVAVGTSGNTVDVVYNF